MTRTVRLVAILGLALFLGSAVAEARGGGGRGGARAGAAATSGGGMKRGATRNRRVSAQAESLVQESFRRDALRRLRHADW
jgi:hypothetical protein